MYVAPKSKKLNAKWWSLLVVKLFPTKQSTELMGKAHTNAWAIQAISCALRHEMMSSQVIFY